MQDLVQRLVPLFYAEPTDVLRQNAFAQYFIDSVVEAAIWCKDPAFAEQQEWRIFYVRTTDQDPLELEHRTGKGLLIPFVEFHPPMGVGAQPNSLPITRINCGPWSGC